MSLAQLKNTGDLEATEFSEISYAGKGDGASVYIDTGILPKDVTYFKIRKTYNDAVNTYECAVGCNQTINSSATYLRIITYKADGIGLERMYCGSSSYKLVIGLVENHIYDYIMQIVEVDGLYNCICTVQDLLGNIIYTDTILNFDKTRLNGITNTIRIFANNPILYTTFNSIYSFTINSETWYINKGTGNTITGSNGTVLTINGTLTNFWQQSDIWNEDANLKMYNTGLVKCNEFDEVATTYAGKGDGSSVYIDTGIPANTIDNFEITFKYYNSGGTIDSLAGAYSNGISQRFIPVFRVSNVLYWGIGDLYTTWNINSVVTNGGIYTATLIKNSDNNATLRIYNHQTQTITFNNTKDFTGSVATSNLWIYAKNYTARTYTVSTIYSFTINNETWYINNGSGNTITGSLGTELTINGTLTNFWQPSEIWNDPAQMKLLENELDIRNEIIEV